MTFEYTITLSVNLPEGLRLTGGASARFKLKGLGTVVKTGRGASIALTGDHWEVRDGEGDLVLWCPSALVICIEARPV